MRVTSEASATFVSIPPRKMRRVVDLVRGLPVERALNILNFTTKVAAVHIAKTLKSAAANAMSVDGRENLKPETLLIKRITVDEAPAAKRIRYQSMGRVYRYKKRHSRLRIILEGTLEPKAKPGASKAKKADAKAVATESTPVAATSAPKKRTATKKAKS